jgi:hypothetical protein
MTDYKIKENLETMIDEHIKRLSTILINNNEKEKNKYKAELEILKLDNTNKVNEIVLSNYSLSRNLQKKQEELLQKEQLYQAMINQIETAKYTTHKLHDSYGGNIDEIKNIINQIKSFKKKYKSEIKVLQPLIIFDLKNGSIEDLKKLKELTNELIPTICQKINAYCPFQKLLENLLAILEKAINEENQEYDNIYTLDALDDTTSSEVATNVEPEKIKNKHKIKKYFTEIENIQKKIIKITTKIVYGTMPDSINEELLIDLGKIVSFKVNDGFIEDFLELIINYIPLCKNYCKRLSEHKKYTPFCDIKILLKKLIKILKKDSDDEVDSEAFKYDDDNLDEVKSYTKKHKIKKEYHVEITNKIEEIRVTASGKICSDEIAKDIYNNFVSFNLDEGFIEDLVESTIRLISISKEMCEQTKDYCKSKYIKEFQYKYIYKNYCNINKLLKELIKILEIAYEGEENSKTIEYYHTLDEDIYIENAEKEEEVYIVKEKIRKYLKLIKEKYDESKSGMFSKISILPNDKIKDVLDFVLKKYTVEELKDLIEKLIIDAKGVLEQNESNYKHGKDQIRAIILHSLKILELIDSIAYEYTGETPKNYSANANKKKEINRLLGIISDNYPIFPDLTITYGNIKSLIYNSIVKIKLKKRTIPDLRPLIEKINVEATRLFYETDKNPYNINKAIGAIMISSRAILEIIDEQAYSPIVLEVNEKISKCLKLIEAYYRNSHYVSTIANSTGTSFLPHEYIQNVLVFNVNYTFFKFKSLISLKPIIEQLIEGTEEVCQGDDTYVCDEIHSIKYYSEHIIKLIDSISIKDE